MRALTLDEAEELEAGLQPDESDYDDDDFMMDSSDEVCGRLVALGLMALNVRVVRFGDYDLDGEFYDTTARGAMALRIHRALSSWISDSGMDGYQ